MVRGRTTSALDLPMPDAFLHREGAATKQDLCYLAIRDAIMTGRLSRGLRLPSTRTLALRWGVSRGTAEFAYDRLFAEGYVARRPGSGTFVSAVVPDHLCQASMPPSAFVERVEKSRPAGDMPDPVVDPLPPGAEGVGVAAGKPFVARLPDAGLFSGKKWAGYLSRAAKATGSALSGTDALGDMLLRQQVAEYLRRYRQVNCSAADIIVTTGIRHGLDLLARALLRPGDKVCVEDPGYPSARKILLSTGASVVDVPVDRDGMCVATLQRHPDAKLVYLTPAHQSPLGVCMPISRRLEILAWARRHGIIVLEDDYDSEYSYSGSPLPALSALDDRGTVVHCGSFNKTTYSGMRAGFMLVRGRLAGVLHDMLSWTGRSVSLVEQRALSAYLKDGSYASQLRAARQVYMQRRDCLLRILADEARGCHTVSGHEAGFHCVLWLTHASEASVCAEASKVGISLQPLSMFCRRVRLPPALVIGYASLDMDMIASFARKLSEIIVRCSAR